MVLWAVYWVVQRRAKWKNWSVDCNKGGRESIGCDAILKSYENTDEYLLGSALKREVSCTCLKGCLSTQC